MILGIYGYQDSGKTQMVQKLTASLTKKGYRIATVKHAPHFEGLDTEGKDTWRHWKAGADPVVLSTSTETTMMLHGAIAPEEIIRLIQSSFSPDLIVLEGFKTGDFPRVSIGKIRPTKGTVLENPSFSDLSAYVRENIEAERVRAELPGLDCGKCGLACASMARSIARGERKISDCKELPSRSVTISVNGRRMATGKFVSEIVEDTIRGMLGSLKGYEVGSDVEIRLRPEGKSSRTRSRRR